MQLHVLWLLNIGFNNTSSSMENADSFTCADGYYLSNVSGACRPLCSLWTEPTDIDADYIAIIVAVVVGLLSAVALVILSLTLQRKTMYELIL